MATFEAEAEAVAAANDSQFGLAGAVISADAERCRRVAEALEAGIVWVNCSQPCFCQVGGRRERCGGRVASSRSTACSQVVGVRAQGWGWVGRAPALERAPAGVGAAALATAGAPTAWGARPLGRPAPPHPPSPCTLPPARAPQAPWGGIKDSGFGRELGEWGLDNYLSVKQVTEYVSTKPWDWYLQSKL